MINEQGRPDYSQYPWDAHFANERWLEQAPYMFTLLLLVMFLIAAMIAWAMTSHRDKELIKRALKEKFKS